MVFFHLFVSSLISVIRIAWFWGWRSFVSLLFSCSVMSGSLWPQGLQHARSPCPSLFPRVSSNSCPLSQWCYPTMSSSVAPFSSQSFPESESFPVSRLFASGGQSTETSASTSVLSMNIQGWFPSGLTGLISLLSKGLSRVFSSITVWKHHNSLVLSPALTSVHFSCMSLNIHEHGSAESQVLN